MSKTWKNVELALARLLDGSRVPITGRARGSTPDIEHSDYSIEVKHRKAIPEWIKDAMNQAEASNKGGEKLPIVILHEKHMRFEDSFVMVRLKDLKELT